MIYSVPFAYEMYGRIEVHSESEKEAIEKAEDLLVFMPLSDMHNCSSYLEDSLEIDEEGQILTIPCSRSAENIVWDYDEGEEGSFSELPGRVEIPDEIADDDIADYISDKYGWCVVSFDIA